MLTAPVLPVPQLHPFSSRAPGFSTPIAPLMAVPTVGNQVNPACHIISAVAPHGLTAQSPCLADPPQRPQLSAPSVTPVYPPAHGYATEEYLDRRRPTDPFFYPTTLNPLTGLGINSIQKSTPIKLQPSNENLMSSTQTGTYTPEPPLAGYVAPPIQNWMADVEAMKVLQQQNDSVDRIIQALAHAKSETDAQRFQTVQKIRQRQEQFRREAQDACRSAKELQTDLQLPEDLLADIPNISQGFGSLDVPYSQFPRAESPLDVPCSQFSRAESPGRAYAGMQMPCRPESPAHSIAAAKVHAPFTTETDQWSALPMKLEPSAPLTQASQQFSTLPVLRPVAIPPQAEPTPFMPSTGHVVGETPPMPSETASPAASPSEAVLARQIARDPSDVDLGASSSAFAGTSGFNAGCSSAPMDVPSRKISSNQWHVAPVPLFDALGRPLVEKWPELPNIKDEPTQPEPGPDRIAPFRTPPQNPACSGANDGNTGVHAAQERVAAVVHAGIAPVSARNSETSVSSARGGQAAEAETVPTGQTNQTDKQGVSVGSGHESPSVPSGSTTGGVSGSSGRGVLQRQQDSQPEGTAQRSGGTRSRRSPGSSASTVRSANSQGGSGNAGIAVVAIAETEELQAELEECSETIKICASSVTKDSLQDMKGIQKPASVVKDVLEASSLLVGQPESKWDKLKKFVVSDGFLQKVQKFSVQNVTKDQFKKLREYLGRPDFDEELIKTVCVPVVPLAIWCRSIGVYLSKTKFKGGGEVRPVAATGANNQPLRRNAPSGDDVGYMIFDPNIEEMSAEQLRCVPELSISRPGVGVITFHGETDCTGLDFDRIVRLEIGEVLVYPDAGLKPNVGTDLNKAATVTMYQCWPPNGSKLLQDPKSQERYKKKIKQMTEEKNAKFIDYDCNTGIWKFAVDHF